MSNAGIPVSFAVQIPKELQADDFDFKVVKEALRTVGKKIQRSAKKKLSDRKGSLYPRLQTGRLRKAVKVHVSKKKDKFWVRVQVDSFKDYPFWYPAPLMYGRKDGTLKPRHDAVVESGDELQDESLSEVSDALSKALKGWG